MPGLNHINPLPMEDKPIYEIAGRIPPQALEAEETVIGSCLTESGVIKKVLDFVSVSSFYKPAHQIIFSAMLQLKAENSNIDIITVTNKLRKLQKLDEVGGAYAITVLTSKIGSSVNIEQHAAIVREKEILRNFILFSTD